MRGLRHRMLVPALLALALGHPVAVAAQGSVPLRSGADLFVLDLAGTPLGEIPIGIKQLQGMLEVVLKDGVPMLKASARSEFLITLPQALPADFTLEFGLVPKACCNPQDLSFEGTPTINQGGGSAHVLWDSDGYLAIIGGGPDTYEAPMPEELRTTLPGVLTNVVAVFQGPTVRLYTNGRRMYTLDRTFARGRVLRVFLGGQDDNTQAVYLAWLRIGAGAVSPGVVAANPTPPPGQPAQPRGNVRSKPPEPASPTVLANVSVAWGESAPFVTWDPVPVPAAYSVRRWKIDDPACCNAASPQLSGPPWQDMSPRIPGTYVYEVTATMPGGTASGQAQFLQLRSGGSIKSVAEPESPPATAPSPGTRLPFNRSVPTGAQGG